MNVIWILITVSFGNPNMINFQEFLNKESCEFAKQEIAIMTNHAKTVCIPKG